MKAGGLTINYISQFGLDDDNLEEYFLPNDISRDDISEYGKLSKELIIKYKNKVKSELLIKNKNLCLKKKR